MHDPVDLKNGKSRIDLSIYAALILDQPFGGRFAEFLLKGMREMGKAFKP